MVSRIRKDIAIDSAATRVISWAYMANPVAYIYIVSGDTTSEPTMNQSLIEDYFRELKELEQSELFLTDKVDLIEEVRQNTIHIGISNEIAGSVKATDLIRFLNRVKTNRISQLARGSYSVNLIYYLWFDEMAGQLRAVFINSNHKSLPFECAVSYANNEQEIVEAFLLSNCLEGVPFEDLTEITNNDDALLKSEPLVLKVYKETFPKAAV